MKRKVVLLLSSILVLVMVGWLLYNKYRVVIPPVNTAKSEIGWSAKSVSDTHVGKIQLQKASLKFQNKVLIGGEFQVDMKSITVEDITEAEDKSDFIHHITTEDFFETNSYPTASFVISQTKLLSNSQYEVKGNMTIKNITKPIQFTTTVLEQSTGKQRLIAQINIDRTQFGIEYGAKGKRGSEKDWFINNDFALNVNIISE